MLAPNVPSLSVNQAFAALQQSKTVSKPGSRKSGCWSQDLPLLSQGRKVESLNESPLNLEAIVEGVSQELGSGAANTVLYLAYGSNLSAETFQGNRGIRPVSQVNVVVPDLVMTFDLAGLPYTEPCFANTKYRSERPDVTTSSEKAPLLPAPLIPTDYHKTRWKKGLVGVVYEVTKEDYAHIIATEGGGAAYQDVVIDCYELQAGENTVPQHPQSQPFKAHTLYCPPPTKGGRFVRPDPNYAQASPRYLKLITDGADEHSLPLEYKVYLQNLRPYTASTAKQRLGQFLFILIFRPLIHIIFGLFATFADDKGRVPPWLANLSGAVFKSFWGAYDLFFYPLFGDGERTNTTEEEHESVNEMGRSWISPRLYGSVDEKQSDVNQMV
ncbi:hypothetical protein MMC12_003431 [Toensbergia leucococca]|nr:hypothetical protein [Toensbergia leucococca]